MTLDWRNSLMLGFIAAVFVACLFGPYMISVVLGGLDRWLQALADADDDPGVPDPDDLSWYRAPQDWQLSDLPFSIESFITTMQGTLYTRH